MAEQRKFTRIDFNAEAALTIGPGHWQSELLDISFKGALIKSPSGEWPHEVGTRGFLDISLTDDKDMRIRKHVRIAHQSDDRIGLYCEDIDVDSMTHLRRLVELNLGDETLLERELSALSEQVDGDHS